MMIEGLGPEVRGAHDQPAWLPLRPRYPANMRLKTLMQPQRRKRL